MPVYPIIDHNLDPTRSMWLWSKYVREPNLKYHCTNSIRGKYSKKFTKLNPNFAVSRRVVLDEEPICSYCAIYICGVSNKGYRKKENYPHNLHAAIIPESGVTDSFEFETWKLEIENGRFIPIPIEEQLPKELRGLPKEYTTCRIFQFAAMMSRT